MIRCVLNFIEQIKYTMAQMGHLLHYNRLANPHVEQFYAKDSRKRLESNPILSPSGCHARGRRSSSQIFTTFSTALDINLASIDLDAEKNVSSQAEEVKANDELFQGSNLMRYFYNTQSFLDDFEESVIGRRKEQLGKYCVWKMKKWVTKYKK